MRQGRLLREQVQERQYARLSYAPHPTRRDAGGPHLGSPMP